MLATLALLACQDQSQVSQIHRSPGFNFPQPGPIVLVRETANGQVLFVEFRPAQQPDSLPFLKFFSLPNPGGAVDQATLYSLGAQEFGNLAAPGGLTAGPATDGILATPGGPAPCRSQDFSSADGAAVARSRMVILQTTPMAAGAMVWLAPGQPDQLLTLAESLIAGVQVLPFEPDALQEMERYGIRFAIPLLWLRQEQEQDGSIGITCQGPTGTVLVSTGAAGIFGGALGEYYILESQRAEADTMAARFGGSVIRQNALMRLVGEELHVGQRFQMKLNDGSLAEIRNAVFSNDNAELCLVSALYSEGYRPAMLGWMDRLLAEVKMPYTGPQHLETRSWSGISARFPERLEVEEREPGDLLPGGWTFTIPHDGRPEDHSFQLRLWREDPPAAPEDARQELRADLDDLMESWTGGAATVTREEKGQAFGAPADLLQASVLQDGLEFRVDARRVTTPGGVFQSLAYYPADLESEHKPVLDLILARSALGQSGAPLATSHGARILPPGPNWRLRDYWSSGAPCFSLSNGAGMLVICQPADELTPEHDLAEVLAAEYFDGDPVEERLELQLSGSALPAVLTSFEHEDEGREVTSIEFHALFAHDGVVWHLEASGDAGQRTELLAALAGIALPGR